MTHKSSKHKSPSVVLISGTDDDSEDVVEADSTPEWSLNSSNVIDKNVNLAKVKEFLYLQNSDKIEAKTSSKVKELKTTVKEAVESANFIVSIISKKGSILKCMFRTSCTFLHLFDPIDELNKVFQMISIGSLLARDFKESIVNRAEV